MKKYILTMITCAATLPMFAFNFNGGNFKIDTEIKTQINTTVLRETDLIAQTKSKQKVKESKQYVAEEILHAIEAEIRLARKHIERNANMRDRFPNHKFIQEQKIQKQRYDNIVKWNIPSKILAYIETNFDLQQIKNIKVICKYVNETVIEVRFSYNMASFAVDYTYTETPQKPLITHRSL